MGGNGGLMEGPETTYLTASPWVTLTYLFPDEEVGKLGVFAVVFACHRCGATQVVSAPPPLPFDEAVRVYGKEGEGTHRAVRDFFEAAHQHERAELDREATG